MLLKVEMVDGRFALLKPRFHDAECSSHSTRSCLPRRDAICPFVRSSSEISSRKLDSSSDEERTNCLFKVSNERALWTQTDGRTDRPDGRGRRIGGRRQIRFGQPPSLSPSLPSPLVGFLQSIFNDCFSQRIFWQNRHLSYLRAQNSTPCHESASRSMSICEARVESKLFSEMAKFNHRTAPGLTLCLLRPSATAMGSTGRPDRVSRRKLSNS